MRKCTLRQVEREEGVGGKDGKREGEGVETYVDCRDVGRDRVERLERGGGKRGRGKMRKCTSI
jgi:hypothetical protein